MESMEGISMELTLHIVCRTVASVASHSTTLSGSLLEKKRKEKTTPFSVNLMRSQVLYRAAQTVPCYSMHRLCL